MITDWIVNKRGYHGVYVTAIFLFPRQILVRERESQFKVRGSTPNHDQSLLQSEINTYKYYIYMSFCSKSPYIFMIHAIFMVISTPFPPFCWFKNQFHKNDAGDYYKERKPADTCLQRGHSRLSDSENCFQRLIE